jgi:hypothetical protein
MYSIFMCVFLTLCCAVLQSYRLVKMTDVKERRICIKFCFKLGKTAVETHKILKEAFGDNALGLTQNGLSILKRRDVSRQRRQAFWTTFNRNHDRKCGKSARGYPGRPKANDSQCL